MDPPEAPANEYHLLERLSGVDSCRAYLAKLVGARGFEKRVVLWRFRSSSARPSDLVRAVLRETRASASLRHANIAQVLDLRIDSRTCWVATEHVPGCSFDQAIRAQRRLSWRVTARIAIEIAAALAYVHGVRQTHGELLGLVHGRLCPERIALGAGGDVKITGFGVTHAWEPHPAYRAPEQARGEPLDGRADVFALGAILRRCLHGADAPEALRHLVEHAMKPYPEQRPTASTLQQQLICILHAAKPRVTVRDIAALAAAGARAPKDPDRDRATIDRIERAIDSCALDRRHEREAMLDLYEKMGRLCLEARAGERAIAQMTRGLDLAVSLGHDDRATVFCQLRSQLLAQLHRSDESRDWIERAGALRGQAVTRRRRS